MRIIVPNARYAKQKDCPNPAKAPVSNVLLQTPYVKIAVSLKPNVSVFSAESAGIWYIRSAGNVPFVTPVVFVGSVSDAEPITYRYVSTAVCATSVHTN